VEKTVEGIKINENFFDDSDGDLIKLVDKWSGIIEFVRKARIPVIVRLGDIEVVIRPTDTSNTAQ